jgi:hypothetical protein
MSEAVADVLALVQARDIVFHPGCWGTHEGFTTRTDAALSGADRAALHHAWHAGLITTGPVLNPYYRRRPVSVTAAGLLWLRAQRPDDPAATSVA